VASEPKPLTSDSSASSASDTTIICTPVGTPRRSTATSSAGRMRISRRNAASGASGLFLRRRCQPSHSVATTKATTEAQAPLATPSCGSPAQPRISAGVSTRPTVVEIISVSIGAMVSPTPRSIAVDSRNTKSPGIATSMMRA